MLIKLLVGLEDLEHNTKEEKQEYGKVIQTSPINWVTRIIVMTKGVSISSNLILECSKRKIDIDFINKSKPYAQITYYENISNELHLKQIDIKNSKKGLKIAKAIIKAKMKNQINLVKYYSRYRENKQPKIFLKLERLTEQMEGIFKKIKNAKDIPALMGYEGSLSVLYWKSFGILIDEKNFKWVYKLPQKNKQIVVNVNKKAEQFFDEIKQKIDEFYRQ